MEFYVNSLKENVYKGFAKSLIDANIFDPRTIAQLSPEIDLVQDLHMSNNKLIQLKNLLESTFHIPIRCLSAQSTSIKIDEIIRQLIVYSDSDQINH